MSGVTDIAVALPPLGSSPPRCENDKGDAGEKASVQGGAWVTPGPEEAREVQFHAWEDNEGRVLCGHARVSCPCSHV